MRRKISATNSDEDNDFYDDFEDAAYYVDCT